MRPTVPGARAPCRLPAACDWRIAPGARWNARHTRLRCTTAARRVHHLSPASCTTCHRSACSSSVRNASVRARSSGSSVTPWRRSHGFRTALPAQPALVISRAWSSSPCASRTVAGHFFPGRFKQRLERRAHAGQPGHTRLKQTTDRQCNGAPAQMGADKRPCTSIY